MRPFALGIVALLVTMPLLLGFQDSLRPTKKKNTPAPRLVPKSTKDPQSGKLRLPREAVEGLEQSVAAGRFVLPMPAACAISDDGKRLCYEDAKRRGHLLDLNGNDPDAHKVRVLDGEDKRSDSDRESGYRNSLILSSDGKWVFGLRNNGLALWDADTNKRLILRDTMPFDMQGVASSFYFSKDNRRVLLYRGVRSKGRAVELFVISLDRADKINFLKVRSLPLPDSPPSPNISKYSMAEPDVDSDGRYAMVIWREDGGPRQDETGPRQSVEDPRSVDEKRDPPAGTSDVYISELWDFKTMTRLARTGGRWVIPTFPRPGRSVCYVRVVADKSLVVETRELRTGKIVRSVSLPEPSQLFQEDSESKGGKGNGTVTEKDWFLTSLGISDDEAQLALSFSIRATEDEEGRLSRRYSRLLLWDIHTATPKLIPLSEESPYWRSTGGFFTPDGFLAAYVSESSGKITQKIFDIKTRKEVVIFRAGSKEELTLYQGSRFARTNVFPRTILQSPQSGTLYWWRASDKTAVPLDAEVERFAVETLQRRPAISARQLNTAKSTPSAAPRPEVFAPPVTTRALQDERHVLFAFTDEAAHITTLSFYDLETLKPFDVLPNPPGHRIVVTLSDRKCYPILDSFLKYVEEEDRSRFYELDLKSVPNLFLLTIDESTPELYFLRRIPKKLTKNYADFTPKQVRGLLAEAKALKKRIERVRGTTKP